MVTVAIVDYDPTWPEQFEQVAAALRRHLGDAAVAIDHIGSTAVPGLAAPWRLEVVAGASHLFEEPGALDEVARLAAGWFAAHLGRPGRRGGRSP